MSERLTDMAVRPTAENYALPTSQEVEDEITEHRSIVTAHVQSEESRPLWKTGASRSLKDITKAKPRRRAPWK
jgi:plasmid stability protein